jgi:hypothetical protein
MTQPTPKHSSGQIFCYGLGLAAAGGAAFTIGIHAAFGRAGNWSNSLAGLGVGLLVIAGLTMIVATFVGLAEAIRKRRVNWSLPFAIIAAALALWGGWVAINL